MNKFEGLDPNYISKWQIYQLFDEIPPEYQGLDELDFEELYYEPLFIEWFWKNYHQLIDTTKKFKNK